MSSDDFEDDDFRDEEFQDDDEKKEFENFYAAYLRGKELTKFVNEYYVWLERELKDHDYAIVPYKYTGIKNLPICLIKSAKRNPVIYMYILN
jgi:hypothetical protein